jgi:hypothetical protein
VGSDPLWVNDAVGKPVVVTLNVLRVPTTKDVDAALVMAGEVGRNSSKVMLTEPLVETTYAYDVAVLADETKDAPPPPPPPPPPPAPPPLPPAPP